MQLRAVRDCRKDHLFSQHSPQKEITHGLHNLCKWSWCRHGNCGKIQILLRPFKPTSTPSTSARQPMGHQNTVRLSSMGASVPLKIAISSMNFRRRILLCRLSKIWLRNKRFLELLRKLDRVWTILYRNSMTNTFFQKVKGPIKVLSAVLVRAPLWEILSCCQLSNRPWPGWYDGELLTKVSMTPWKSNSKKILRKSTGEAKMTMVSWAVDLTIRIGAVNVVTQAQEAQTVRKVKWLQSAQKCQLSQIPVRKTKKSANKLQQEKLGLLSSNSTWILSYIKNLILRGSKSTTKTDRPTCKTRMLRIQKLSLCTKDSCGQNVLWTPTFITRSSKRQVWFVQP